MGKASSSKKVARAARAGGSIRATRDRKWGFPLTIAGIVLAGSLLVVFVRENEVSEAAEPPRLGRDHWHAAYGLYLCDTFGPPQSDTMGDRYGIHTHDDGLIHIHPSTGQASGANARLGRFAEEIGLEFGEDSFTTADGQSFATGDDCGGEEGVVRVLKWAPGDFEGEPEIISSDFADIRFTGDGEAFTIFFGPESALEDPKDLLPPSLAGINEVSDLGPGQEPPNVDVPEDLLAPPTTTSTTATDGTTTTAPADGTTTTAAPTTSAPGTSATGG